MLVFISDLHLVDGSAGEHNVPARAFEYFFQDVAASVKPATQEIKIVFLGDIFDLLRTEKWFGAGVEERPWGSPEKEAEVEGHANEVFEAMAAHQENRLTLKMLGGSLKERFGLPVEPQRIYIPGNHDRLCNRYPSLREKVCQALGVSHDPAQPFPHSYQEVAYGVFARHGHEFDRYNYDGGPSYGEMDYQRVPIGDPITTELVARIPYELGRRLEQFPPEERAQIRRNFQEIENVRPLSAVIEWLLYQVHRERRLKDLIEDSIDTVIRAFNDLDSVKAWYRAHDKWTDFWDEADKIQACLFLLEKFKVFPAEKILSCVMKAKDYLVRDDLREAAPNEYLHLDNRIRYVVYGHTHEPLNVPIRTVKTDAGLVEHVYLNTGTWRAQHRRAAADSSFISWKNMTYVIFYGAGERGNDFPVFETWTGALKTI
jgi:UDP-2,3-diacylglucosamine pyrophosphatase LpxH